MWNSFVKFLDHPSFRAYYFAAEIYLKTYYYKIQRKWSINVVFVIETSMLFSERYFNKSMGRNWKVNLFVSRDTVRV